MQPTLKGPTYVQLLSRGGTGSMSLLLQPRFAKVVSSGSSAHFDGRRKSTVSMAFRGIGRKRVGASRTNGIPDRALLGAGSRR